MEYKQLSQTKWEIEAIVDGKKKILTYDFPYVINQVGWDFENIKKVKKDNGDRE